MKIKPENKTRKKRLMARVHAYHKWLIPSIPKKAGRLSSQNKANKKAKRRIGPSEFIQMCHRIEGLA